MFSSISRYLFVLCNAGKSQIAIEYAHRYYSSSCYELVAWFRAESAASIAADMRKLAFDLGIIQEGQRNTVHDISKSEDYVDEDEEGTKCKMGSERGHSSISMDKGTDTAKDLEEYDDTYIINELMRRLGLCRLVIIKVIFIVKLKCLYLFRCVVL